MAARSQLWAVEEAAGPQRRLRRSSWVHSNRCRMVQPLAKPKRVKKFGFKRFNRHQCDRKIAVKVGHLLQYCRQ